MTLNKSLGLRILLLLKEGSCGEGVNIECYLYLPQRMIFLKISASRRLLAGWPFPYCHLSYRGTLFIDSLAVTKLWQRIRKEEGPAINAGKMHFFLSKVTLRRESKENRNAKGCFIIFYTACSELLNLMVSSPTCWSKGTKWNLCKVKMRCCCYQFMWQ